MKPLLRRLVKLGIVTDTLSFSTADVDDATLHKDTQVKYMGVARLDDEHRHRRLDVIAIPWFAFGCSLLYFTGSDYFNRSMRHWAKQRGLTLSQNGVARAIRQHRDKVRCKHQEEEIYSHLLYRSLSAL